MRTGWRRSHAAPLLLLIGAMALSGCGVIEDTVAGLTGQGPSRQSASPNPPDGGGAEDLTVTITVESDSDISGELSVELVSPSGNQSLREDSVGLPFTRDFTVPTDKIFPLRDTRVEVTAGPGASYIECSITMNGEVVASHRAEGSAAQAACDRRLKLGPS